MFVIAGWHTLIPSPPPIDLTHGGRSDQSPVHGLSGLPRSPNAGEAYKQASVENRVRAPNQRVWTARSDGDESLGWGGTVGDVMKSIVQLLSHLTICLSFPIASAVPELARMVRIH